MVCDGDMQSSYSFLAKDFISLHVKSIVFILIIALPSKDHLGPRQDGCCGLFLFLFCFVCLKNITDKPLSDFPCYSG